MNDMIKEAKLKALSLLNFMDRTESQLRQKLKEKQFDEEAIEEAMQTGKTIELVRDAAADETVTITGNVIDSYKELRQKAMKAYAEAE